MPDSLSNRKKTAVCLFFAVLFIGLCVFFLVAHPLYLFDTDDWRYAGQTRRPVPLWGDHNPTRILPEVLMPFATDIAVYTLYRFTGDYVGSIAVIYGLLLSLCITVYFVFWYGFLKQSCPKTSIDQRIFLLSLSVLFHFWIFNTNSTNNLHAFSANDVTCVFYYVIPSLFCSSFVFFLWGKEFGTHQETTVLDAILLAAAYLAIFSNLFQSIILASFAFVRLMFNSFYHNKIERLSVLRKNTILLFILIIWLISLVFEANGNRAHQLEAYSSGLALRETARRLVKFLRTMNRGYGVLTAVIIFSALGLCLTRKQRDQFDNDYLKRLVELICCLFLTSVFLFLLCAKVGAGYIAHTRVLFGSIFYLYAITFLSFGYLIHRLPRLFLIVPILTVLVFNDTVSDNKQFADYNVRNHRASVCHDITNHIIHQAKEADRQNKDAVAIHVPDYGGDNWPIGLYGGRYVSWTMYKHGLTHKRMEINLVSDREINEEYGIY